MQITVPYLWLNNFLISFYLSLSLCLINLDDEENDSEDEAEDVKTSVNSNLLRLVFLQTSISTLYIHFAFGIVKTFLLAQVT